MQYLQFKREKFSIILKSCKHLTASLKVSVFILIGTLLRTFKTNAHMLFLSPKIQTKRKKSMNCSELKSIFTSEEAGHRLGRLLDDMEEFVDKDHRGSADINRTFCAAHISFCATTIVNEARLIDNTPIRWENSQK